jgi:hypothetical protein
LEKNGSADDVVHYEMMKNLLIDFAGLRNSR